MLKLLDKALCAACLCAFAATVSACAGNQPPTTPFAAGQQAAVRRATDADLLYVGAGTTGTIYSFPDAKFVGTFNTAATIHAMCSDEKGNVFITASQKPNKGPATGFVYEYAHGGTSPVATLTVPSREIPVSCSRDPKTGNLAVISYDSRNFAPLVEVYAGGSGTPATYTSHALGAKPQAAYDDTSDLFVTSGGNQGAELVKGGQQLETIAFDQTLGGADHLQWDGADFALQSFHKSKYEKERVPERILRLQISGKRATVVGLSKFTDWLAGAAGQSWIDEGTIVATPGKHIAFWKYPAGGKALLILHPTNASKAVTISNAK